MDHTVLLGDRAPESVPLGYRTVRLVPFTGLGHVRDLLAPYQAGLQTAVLAAPLPRLLSTGDPAPLLRAAQRWIDAAAQVERLALPEACLQP